MIATHFESRHFEKNAIVTRQPVAITSELGLVDQSDCKKCYNYLEIYGIVQNMDWTGLD